MHIVFAGNQRFVPYLGVAMHSILRHASRDEPIRFSVLETGMRESDRQRLGKVCNVPGVELDFKQVDASRFQGAPLSRFRSYEPYFRLLIPDLYPESPRALYLDGDIVVCDDVTALYAYDLKGQPIGACDDVSATKHMQRLGLKQYFNSGVLLMDLELWRKENLYDQLMDYLSEHRDRLLFEDQDVLNLALEERFTPIDLRWNVFSIFFSKSISASFFSNADLESSLKNPGIIHFAGKFKPYFIENAGRINWRYFGYARRTPFSWTLLLNALWANLRHLRWWLTKGIRKGKQ